MDLTMEIEKYKGQGANVLMPSTMIGGLSEFHQPVIEAVQLSPNPSEGDVYEDKQNNKFRLTKQALVKLSNCAGVSWHPYETKRVDNRVDRDYVAYQAVGGIRKADGSSIAFKAEYDMDFEVIEEELRTQYTAKASKGTEEQKKKYIEDSVRREMLFKRKHKVKLCEAGAMNRVIRSLLGLKNGYTTAELQKPFVTVRIVIRPDYTDKDVRRQMMRAAVKSMTGIYGDSSETGGNGNGTHDCTNYDDFDGKVIDIPIDDDGYAPPGLPEGPAPQAHSTTSETSQNPTSQLKANGKSVKEQEIDFSNCDQAEQLNILEALIKRKVYDTSSLKKPLSEFNETNCIQFFKKLLTLPDAPAPAADNPDGDLGF